jgi:2-polyprenyl-3-methyl-5-hydroxy-6-metoxy-1,4-benzoquinol methylase
MRVESPEMTPEQRAVAEETRSLWERKAAFWDERMTEGNLFHTALVAPATKRLLAVQPGETVLDVACGYGQWSRRLAQLGASVVAVDFSAAFIEAARARTTEHRERIDYRVLDATDRAQLRMLGHRRFDAALCSMSLMDMSAIDPLIESLGGLLKLGGRFVFSILHPCFNSNAAAMVAERVEREGESRTEYAVKVARYLHVAPGKGAGIPGEPVPHYYFHRPLSQLLTTCFRAGFVMDALEEPAFEEPAPSAALLSWTNYTDIPPVFAARLRLSS